MEEKSEQEQELNEEGQEENSGPGTEMRTKQGFYKAQAHERTTDLTMLDKIVY